MHAEYEGTRSQQANEVFIDQPVRAFTQQLADERLNQIRALAAFSSDALLSIGYANQEIYLGSLVAGSAGLLLVWPIGLAVNLGGPWQVLAGWAGKGLAKWPVENSPGWLMQRGEFSVTLWAGKMVSVRGRGDNDNSTREGNIE